MDKVTIVLFVVVAVLFLIAEVRDRWFRDQEEKEDEEEPAGA